MSGGWEDAPVKINPDGRELTVRSFLSTRDLLRSEMLDEDDYEAMCGVLFGEKKDVGKAQLLRIEDGIIVAMLVHPRVVPAADTPGEGETRLSGLSDAEQGGILEVAMSSLSRAQRFRAERAGSGGGVGGDLGGSAVGEGRVPAGVGGGAGRRRAPRPTSKRA